MTDAAATVSSDPAVYVEAWAQSFSQVLGQIAGAQVSCAMFVESPAEFPPPGANDLWILCTCASGLRGEMSLRLAPATVLRIAQLFMSEPAAPEAELTADHRDAVIEFLRQVGGLVASALKARWGEVQLRIEMATGPASWPASSSSWIKASNDDLVLWIEFHLSAALVATLRVEQSTSEKSTANPATSPAPAPQENSGKLGLLMDVELAMTLRFGSRRLLLREVLDLSPGTVIELDRQVQEPVDVLLDGRLVARGEVVVMDGNYGLRVTEVVSAGAM